MPTDTQATDDAGKKPAERLKEIRARVAELRRRIKTERDPKAVAELRAEVGKLTALLSELAQGGGAAGVEKAEPVAWPRDLNAGPEGESEWGADPVEVAGG